jgi:hypothetical protein
VVGLGVAWLMGAACGRTPVQELFSRQCREGPIASLACSSDLGCAHEVLELGSEPPKVLLQLDRSCSMEPRWPVAIAALRDVLDTRGPEADWGLSMFPDRELSTCEQGAILIPIGAGHDGVIRETLVASLDPQHEAYPSGPCPTNIGSAVGQTGTDPAFREGDAARVVLLITDGWDTCDGEDSAQGVVDLVARLHDDRGISTYVISFGGGVSADNLTALATAGGTARPGGVAYYQASGEDLGEIVDEIIGGLRCTYAVDIALDDLGLLEVVLDGAQIVPENGLHGWTYDTAAKAVRFHGETCEHLMDSAVSVAFALRCG